VAALLTWPPDGIPPFAPCTPPTPGAWDGEPAAHRRRASPQQPAGPAAQAAEARRRALEQAENDEDGPQTAWWSGSGPACGRGHAPRAQGRYPPTAESHARTIMRLEATINDYTRALEQMEEDDDGPQTARWSGGGPSRGCGHPSRGTRTPRMRTPTSRRLHPGARADGSRRIRTQTARWRGGGPGRGCGIAPQTAIADRTHPRETAR
jgi:hypothetical protein